jgi:hypothetical protein
LWVIESVTGRLRWTLRGVAKYVRQQHQLSNKKNESMRRNF